MPQVQKEEVRRRILAAAVEEFHARDYRTATMRGIAARAGIPAGLTYSYFASKAALFAAVVAPVLEVVGGLFQEGDRGARPSFDNLLTRESSELLSLARAHRRQLVILTDKSQDTAYERAKEKLVEGTQAHIKRNLLKMAGKSGAPPGDFFIHLLAGSFVEGFLEIARHYQDDRWASEMIGNLTTHFAYGVRGLLWE